jgi:hypothetical protein
MRDRPLTIRMAAHNDAAALARPARLDSARPLRGSVLLAELDGAPVAAVSLETGAVTADPFQHTADAVHVLTLRRDQLAGAGSDVARPRPRLRRLAPRPAR